jgi:hypothetical protein
MPAPTFKTVLNRMAAYAQDVDQVIASVREQIRRVDRVLRDIERMRLTASSGNQQRGLSRRINATAGHSSWACTDLSARNRCALAQHLDLAGAGQLARREDGLLGKDREEALVH